MQSLSAALPAVQPGQTVPVPDSPGPAPARAQPTWFVVVLALGLAVLAAALCFFLLQALGVDRVGGGSVLVIAVLSAVVGGFLARSVAARLPPVTRSR